MRSPKRNAMPDPASLPTSTSLTRPYADTLSPLGEISEMQEEDVRTGAPKPLDDRAPVRMHGHANDYEPIGGNPLQGGSNLGGAS